MSATCGYVACARREQLVSVLIKASLDLAAEVESLKASAAIKCDEKARIQSIVERTYDACEQLGEKIGVSADVEKTPCEHVVVVADECAKCGAEA